MISKRLHSPLKAGLWLLAIVALLALLIWGLNAVSQGSRSAGLAAAQDALRRCVMQCYAIEGVYPPNVDYLREHYGLSINESAYLIHYRVTGANLLPEMAVLPRE